MSEELRSFASLDFGEVRTMMRDGEPWFVASDVCRALGVGNSRMALERLDADEKADVSLTDTSSNGTTQRRRYSIVNEPGLYSLVLGSRKPEAKAFKRWIVHDVIPVIRKTGGYVYDDDAFINTYLPYADETTTALFRSTLETVRSLNAKIEADKPKVLFAESVEASQTSILVGELAKLLKQNGVDVGQNRLFRWLRECGYLTKKNEPTQYAMNLNLFEVVERTVNNPDGSIRLTRTTKVTGKGQTYFINKFLMQ